MSSYLTSAVMVLISSVSRFVLATLKHFSDRSDHWSLFWVVSVAFVWMYGWYLPVSLHFLELTESYILIMY